jgi:hypothetical protein
MQELKERLADLLWEVEVVPAPDHPMVDPSSVQRRYGQAVLVDAPTRGPRLLVSGDLVRGWTRIDARRRGGAACSGEVAEELADLDLALIRCREPLAGPVVPLAPDELAVEGALVFSLDNPAQALSSIYYGFLAGGMEPPLAEFHLVHLGGTWSFPLLSHRGELVAITIRRLRPQPDTLAMAATCLQLRRALTARRRGPEGPERLRESTQRPFYYD